MKSFFAFNISIFMEKKLNILLIIINYLLNIQKTMSKSEGAYSLANEKFSKSKYEEALKLLNNIKTKDYDFYLLRSKIYYEINDFYLSLQDIKECIKQNDQKEEAYQISSKCYLNMYNYEEARKQLELAKKISPSSKENKEIEEMINKKITENEENCKKFNQYKIFLNYMKVIYSYGVYINKIKVKWESDWMRCILASDYIKTNDILIRVPDDLLITLDSAQNSEIGKYFDEPLRKKLNSPHHCLLTAYLLQEKKRKIQVNGIFIFHFYHHHIHHFQYFIQKKR